MHFTAAADTDVGIFKTYNQDSILIKQAGYSGREVLLAVICDGMGGLSKGELASAAAIEYFADWFETELPWELENLNMQVIGREWSLMVKKLNGLILEYSRKVSVSMGTTFTGILFAEGEYVIVHVGDSRVYFLDPDFQQLTRDQTFIARELEKGTMTVSEAMEDPRRNMLLQCVGASKVVVPQIITGITQKGIYMLCSDGFRHMNSSEEIRAAFIADELTDKSVMHERARGMIEQAKNRGEKDNISVILIKTE